MSYRQCRVLVTGGLGFLGSNLVLALLDQGARVTVVDSLVAGCGGNPDNLGERLHDIRLIQRDIGQADEFLRDLGPLDYVFNLAGEISHLHSMRDPLRDFRLNAESQLRFLLALSRANPGVRVVYAGTRQVYGRPRQLPVDENHPVCVVDFNGIHKYAAGQYHDVLTSQGAIDAVVLRLTNLYGPRLALDVIGQGFLGAFFRRALNGEPIEVFGRGDQIRDPVYVGDAVRAFLLAGEKRNPEHRLYNLGGSETLSLLELAQLTSAAAGRGSEVRCIPFPEQLAKVDIGSYYTNSKRIQSDLGWKAKVKFKEGAKLTVSYYANAARLMHRGTANSVQPVSSG